MLVEYMLPNDEREQDRLGWLLLPPRNDCTNG